jgi:serine/threonine protein kinase
MHMHFKYPFHEWMAVLRTLPVTIKMAVSWTSMSTDASPYGWWVELRQYISTAFTDPSAPSTVSQRTELVRTAAAQRAAGRRVDEAVSVLEDNSEVLIYVMRDPQAKRTFVVKTARELGRVRLQREVRVHLHLRTLRHLPGASGLLLPAHTTSSMIVTPYHPLGDLFSYLERGKPLGQSQVVVLITDVLQTIAMLHHHGLAHNDIALENIVLAKDSRGMVRAKLIDFEMVTDLSDRSGGCFGGRCGMHAPEMMVEDAPSRVRHPEMSDLWAIGMVLYTVLTSTAPWRHAGVCPDTNRMDPHYAAYQRSPRKFLETRIDAAHRAVIPLLLCLLCINPASRSTARVVLRDTWLQTM